VIVAGVGGSEEVRLWYLEHLRPKLIRAAAGGRVSPGQVAALDRTLRDLVGAGVRLRRNPQPVGSFPRMRPGGPGRQAAEHAEG
jgi:hypothetical protein